MFLTSHIFTFKVSAQFEFISDLFILNKLFFGVILSIIQKFSNQTGNNKVRNYRLHATLKWRFIYDLQFDKIVFHSKKESMVRNTLSELNIHNAEYKIQTINPYYPSEPEIP